MNIKRELIALGIRLLADKTTLVRKPDPFESMLNSLFNTETYDQQLARQIESESERAVEAAKRFKTNVKFKKITKNF
jgi:TPP-dependent pyruvate/acetoin dehydrogenase alpha subunit